MLLKIWLQGEISHYAGMDSNVNSNGLHEQTKHNCHDPRGVMTDHNKAIDDLNLRHKGFMATRNAPQELLPRKKIIRLIMLAYKKILKMEKLTLTKP